MRKVVLSAMCAITALLFLCCPTAYLLDARNRVVQHWLNGNRLAYEGKIVIWSVDAGADGKHALTSWLKSRAAVFESQHFGVYVTVMQSMTTAEVSQRMQTGECPDLLLCGSDVPQAVLQQAVAFQGPFYIEPVLPQLQTGLLTPVFQNGNVMLINEDALYRAGLSPPAGPEGMGSEWVEQTLKSLPNAFGHEDGAALMAAVLSSLPDAAQEAFVRGKACGTDAFLQGDAVIYLAHTDALWELYKGELLGKTLPGTIAYPLKGLARRVQYAILMKNANRARQVAAATFLSALLGKQAQTSLSDIYALPVVSGTTCSRVDLTALWQTADETKYVCPPTGETAFLAQVSAKAMLETLRTLALQLCKPQP